MILTVLTLGGTLLGITAIAGLLTVYQIRQATDLANSAKAIFAADAGIEWSLYDFTCHLDEGILCSDPFPPTCAVAPPGVADPGDPLGTRFFDSDGDNISGPKETSYRIRDEDGKKFCLDTDSQNIKSIGTTGKSSRAFELTL